MRATTQPACIDKSSRKGDSGSCHRGGSSGNQTADNSGSNNQALTSILDLLETRILIEDEERQKSDKAVKMKRDWMLAAAVIDRLCFILLLIVFVAGTLLLLLLFVHS